ncbi:MAG TPA: hypothetical protein VHD35_14570 [Chitinophagaceae bacterium]|nr:hypothetical protein [Chitinophagaceae bacterium]
MKKYLVAFLLYSTSVNLFAQEDVPVINDLLTNMSSQMGNSKSGDLTNFSVKENTEGNQFLFDKWVSGKIFITDSSGFNTAGFSFNYDKMNRKLLATKDKKSMMEVNTNLIKSFELTDAGTTYIFEKVPAISNSFLIQLVKHTGKYSLYKSLTTQFQKANYYNNGIVETGNKYDSYIDAVEYYVLFPDGSYKKVELKRKSIKNAFSADEKKVNTYFSNNNDAVGAMGNIDENFLIGLVSFLDQ